MNDLGALFKNMRAMGVCFLYCVFVGGMMFFAPVLIMKLFRLIAV